MRRALIDPARASLEQRPGDPERGAARIGTSTIGRQRPARPAPRLRRTGQPASRVGEPPRETGDTTSIQVADAAGNLFSATPSSGWLLGGAFVAGDTGVPMSNRMQAFRLDPASPNVLAGGKRPRTTLTPTVVLKDGKPFLAIGTPGGDSQDQQILLVLLNIIDFGMDVQAAIEAPRVNSLHPQSSFDDHRAQPGVLEVERRLPPPSIEELRARGHVAPAARPYGISTGVVAAGIDPATGRLRGGADPAARARARCLLTPTSMEISFSRSTLDNGLDVLVHEDRNCPIVAVNVWYHVGSKNEKPGRTGFAHLFEHLMFEGSQHYDHGYFQPLQEAGASLNGSTNADRTNYWEVVPRNALELALWMESDRMGYLLPALTDAKFNNQRDVVLNERRQNYENRPYGLAGMAIVAELYPPDHPYHWLTIGAADDLRAASLDDVRAFFQTLLPPGQRVAGAGGRRRRRDASRARRGYFGEIPAGERAAAVDAVTPPAAHARKRRLLLEDRVELPRLYLAWHSPALFGPDDAELDLVADVLPSGKTSRLYRALVYEQRIATEVAASQNSRELAGFFQIVATAAPGRTLAELERAIVAEIADARRRGPDGGRNGARHRAGRSALHLPAADRRRVRREVGSAERVQRVPRRSRVLRSRPRAVPQRHGGRAHARGGRVAAPRRARRSQRRAARPRRAGARGFAPVSVS